MGEIKYKKENLKNTGSSWKIVESVLRWEKNLR